MGWELETKKDGAVDKYRIWSTIVDDYIVKEWKTKDEVVKFLFWNRVREFMEALIKDARTFPNKWSNREGVRFYDKKAEHDCYNLLDKAMDDDEVFVALFSEELKKLGIKISVSDGKNGFDLPADEK